MFIAKLPNSGQESEVTWFRLGFPISCSQRAERGGGGAPEEN